MGFDAAYIMQKSIVRIIAGVSPKEHTAPLFFKFKILRLHQLVDYNIGVFMYKVFYKDVPNIFNDYYLPNYEIHDHYTRQKDNIHLEVVKTNRRDMTMRYQGAKVWNIILNNNIMYKRSVAMFKKDFKSYLLSTM